MGTKISLLGFFVVLAMLVASLLVIRSYHNQLSKLQLELKEAKSKVGQPIKKGNSRGAMPKTGTFGTKADSRDIDPGQSRKSDPDPAATDAIKRAEALIDCKKRLDDLFSDLREIKEVKGLFEAEPGGGNLYIQAIVDKIEQVLDLPEPQKENFGNCLKIYYKQRSKIMERAPRRWNKQNRYIFEDIWKEVKGLRERVLRALRSYLEHVPEDKRIMGNKIIDRLFHRFLDYF